MTVVYFLLAILVSVAAGVVFAARLSVGDPESASRDELAGRPASVWISLAVVVGGSAVAVWGIFHEHVLVGVMILVATYLLELAMVRTRIARGRRHADGSPSGSVGK
jgi:hypothetical protein